MYKKYDVAVIGTSFVDVKGFPNATYDALGRNLGQVSFVHGGVGRNVVETMAQFDVSTTFVSTVDHSGLAHEVLQRLQEQGIDVSYVKQVEQGMGMWMAIMNERGDLAGSISQMPSVEVMQEAILENVGQFLQESRSVALEIDLNQRLAEEIIYQAAELKLPLYGIPGNLDVVGKRKDLLAYFQCFICNEIEAEKLTGIALKEEGQGVVWPHLEQAAQELTKDGLEQLVITLGSEGSYYYDRKQQQGEVHPVLPIEVVDTTGAGDAFFAGTVAQLSLGKSLAEAVAVGTQAAAFTIASSESTCRDLKEKLAAEHTAR